MALLSGDGSFSVLKRKNSWSLCYQLGQSTYNIKLMFYIKKMLGIGQIFIDKERHMVTYRVRDRKSINEIIIPIFVKNKLLTSKELDFNVFKKSYEILENKNLTQEQKNLLIEELKKNLKDQKELLALAAGQNNPPLKGLEKNNSVPDYYCSNQMSDDWIIGFWEAKGSFYLLKKNKYYVHAAGCTQKLDRIVLESFRQRFQISAKVRYREKHNFHLLETTNARSIENIVKFFRERLIGVKALEFKLWRRAIKFKNDNEKLLRVQKIMQKLRAIRPNLEDYPSTISLDDDQL